MTDVATGLLGKVAEGKPTPVAEAGMVVRVALACAARPIAVTARNSCSMLAISVVKKCMLLSVVSDLGRVVADELKKKLVVAVRAHIEK